MRRLALALLLFASSPAFAFRGEEHRDITNDALRLALARAQTTGALHAKAATLLDPPGHRDHLTLGDINLIVD
jgi:hypothetical protein